MLTVALVLALLLGLAGAGWLVHRAVFGGYPPPAVDHPALSAKEQAIVAAATDALFPVGGAIAESGAEAGVVLYIARCVARLPRETRALVRLLFAFVEHGPWLFGPRRVRLTRMTVDERVQALGRMATSRIYFLRAAFTSLRTLLAMGYLAHAPVACAIGWASRPEAPETPLPDGRGEPDEGLDRSGERPVVRPIRPVPQVPQVPQVPEVSEVA